MNPEDIPVAAIVSRIFLCQRTLERCLNKIVGDILPTDTVLLQEQYMKNTTKPKKMLAKQWINWLEEMKEMLYWMDNTNYRLDRRTFNIKCIPRNLPLEWKIKFKRADISTRIKNNVPTSQPRNYQIIAQLEQIKRAEVMKREITNVRSKRNYNYNNNQHRGNSNYWKRNMCRKPGYNHEWKDCPDNPRNKNNNKNNSNERDDNSRDKHKNKDREFYMIEEIKNENEMHLIQDDEEITTLLDKHIPMIKIPEKEENNIVDNVKQLRKYSEQKNNDLKVKVCCIFTLTKQGKEREYLGLLDTGSTKSLISSELVEEYEMETEKENGNWNTNTSQFKTTKIATVTNNTLPQWYNKQIIEQTKLAKQKYKAIFGLGFMLANKFDVLFSKAMIKWVGIGVSMYHQRDPRNNECNKLEKAMQENKYTSMDAKEISHLENQKHLDKEQKKWKSYTRI